MLDKVIENLHKMWYIYKVEKNRSNYYGAMENTCSYYCDGGR